MAEGLEARRMLAGDPVIVVLEPIFPDQATTLVQTNHLWTSGAESAFDPDATADATPTPWDGNDLDDHSWPGAALDPLRDALRSAYDGGMWDGAGVTSSLLVAYDYSLFYGVTTRYVGSTYLYSEVYVRRGLPGDVDLSDLVDLADLNLVIQNWLSTTGYWFQGDVNYDGMTNLGDINVITANWLRTM